MTQPATTMEQPATGRVPQPWSSRKPRVDTAGGESLSPQADRQGDGHQGPDNLIRVLRDHARERANQPAFVYLPDGQSGDTVLTYAQLDRRARAVARHLAQ